MSDDFQQRGGSPWGTPPGGGNGNGAGRGPTPPDVDKIIREFQEKIKKFLPGGSSSGGKQVILVLIISLQFINLNRYFLMLSFLNIECGLFMKMITYFEGLDYRLTLER